MSDPYVLLNRITSPDDLKRLPLEELPRVCQELRQFIIETIARVGGHFAAGLGVVELTVALHYVYETPKEKIVWDVGHQSYPHKVLTGRRDLLQTIRQHGGLSGFPKRSESVYDAFGTGHSSTSIAAALGMLEAGKILQQPRRAVAVIGDGAMTAGMAFEAINHAGDLRAPLTVILNDNEMSISENVGALSRYLAQLFSSPRFHELRENSKRVLRMAPPLFEDFARRTEGKVRDLINADNWFEALNFDYYGPTDGHNVLELVAILRNLRLLNRPSLLHIVTQKGKGYAPAERAPIAYHGVSAFDLQQGLQKTPKPLTYTEVFSRWLCYRAERDARLVGITPAMREGSGLVAFSERFPQRYYDVAIAEQHALTFAAGLACEGVKPVVAIYSTFLQRAFDQLAHDVSLQNLPVMLAVDRAGLVGADGATHAGSFDLAYTRILPNLIIMAPADEQECWAMLNTGFAQDAPSVVRYPRSSGSLGNIIENDELLPIGKSKIERRGKSGGLILALGSMLSVGRRLADLWDCSLVNLRFVKPWDRETVLDLARQHAWIVSLEEGCASGGLGQEIAAYLSEHAPRPFKVCGLPDVYLGQGKREELLADAALDEEHLRASIAAWRLTLCNQP